jgi:hypothetical protein
VKEIKGIHIGRNKSIYSYLGGVVVFGFLKFFLVRTRFLTHGFTLAKQAFT